MIKAIKITPSEKRISYLDLKDGSLEIMYGAIGCNLVERVSETFNNDDLWIDEEGMLYEDDELKSRGAFLWKPTGQYLFGNCLIMGSDSNGDASDVNSDIESIKNNIA